MKASILRTYLALVGYLRITGDPLVLPSGAPAEHHVRQQPSGARGQFGFELFLSSAGGPVNVGGIARAAAVVECIVAAVTLVFAHAIIVATAVAPIVAIAAVVVALKRRRGGRQRHLVRRQHGLRKNRAIAFGQDSWGKLSHPSQQGG